MIAKSFEKASKQFKEENKHFTLNSVKTQRNEYPGTQSLQFKS